MPPGDAGRVNRGLPRETHLRNGAASFDVEAWIERAGADMEASISRLRALERATRGARNEKDASQKRKKSRERKYPLIHALEILTECSYRYLQVVIASEPSLGSRLDKPRSAS